MEYVVSNGGNADCAADGSIQTYTGKLVSVFNPDPAKINIIDISNALSKLCRFGGHVRRFYSVAEHSIQCSYRCKPELALHALLHDASEAYMVDMPRPIKIRPEFVLYREIEDRLTIAIARCFDLSIDGFAQIKAIDNFMCYVEAYNLMPRDGEFVWPECPDTTIRLGCWAPDEANLRFLRRYFELTGDASVL